MKLNLVLLVSALGVAGAANAATLSYYSFNNSTAGTGGNLGTLNSTDPDVKDASVTSTSLTNTFAAANFGTFSGTIVNRLDSTYGSGGSLALQNGANGANNGKYVQFGIGSTTSKFSKLVLSFASQRTGTGFNSNQLSYSTDGVSFVDFGSAYSPASSFASAGPNVVQTFDLSSVSALSGVSTVYLRLTFSGATLTSSSGNNRIDNLIIAGDVQAVPEPASMVALGLGAAAMIRRRRKA
jgi:hypothetical protein